MIVNLIDATMENLLNIMKCRNTESHVCECKQKSNKKDVQMRKNTKRQIKCSSINY